jgi:hypothetical protein
VDSVWDSVRDSVWAYIGSIFSGIIKWKYIKHKKGVYPFQCYVDFWNMGLIPFFNGTTWKLLSKNRVEYEISNIDLEKI